IGEGGELAVDRGGPAARFVRGRIFQSSGEFLLPSFQGRDFLLQLVQVLFFFAPCFGRRTTCFSFQTFSRFLLLQSLNYFLCRQSTLRKKFGAVPRLLSVVAIRSRGERGLRRRGFRFVQVVIVIAGIRSQLA